MLSLWLAVSLAQAPKLAAPAWTAVDVVPEKAQFFATHFAGALHDRGVSVITESDIAVLLGVERKKQLLGCADDASSCMIELGAALGAELVLAGSIAKLDATYVVTLRVVRSADGKVVTQEQARATSQDGLLDALTASAGVLAAQLNPAGPPSRSGFRPFLVPTIAAGVTGAIGITCLVLALLTSAELDRRLVFGANRMDVDAIGNRGAAFETVGWVGLGLGVASGVTAVVMKLLEGPRVVALGAVEQDAVASSGGRP